MSFDSVVAGFQRPERLWSRPELAGRLSPVPPAHGIYGWYFDELPADGLEPVGTRVDGWMLLYVGIAPSRSTSASHLRKRIVSDHLYGHAGGSTLRLTLGSLMVEKLGLEPTPIGRKLNFGHTEPLLNEWLNAHARVAWQEHPEPWLIEAGVVRHLGVPLNRDHNEAHPANAIVRAARAAIRSRLRD